MPCEARVPTNRSTVSHLKRPLAGSTAPQLRTKRLVLTLAACIPWTSESSRVAVWTIPKNSERTDAADAADVISSETASTPSTTPIRLKRIPTLGPLPCTSTPTRLLTRGSGTLRSA